MESSSSQTKEKKREKKKKNYKEEKKCKEGKEFSFKLPCCPFIFGSRVAFSFLVPVLPFHFWLPCRPLIFGSRVTFSFLAPMLPSHFWLPCCPLIFGSHFCPLTFAFLFQILSPSIFFFSSIRKEKKTIKKKKNAEKGRSVPSSSHSTLSLLASCFCPFVSNAFSLASSISQVGEKKEKH